MILMFTYVILNHNTNNVHIDIGDTYLRSHQIIFCFNNIAIVLDYTIWIAQIHAPKNWLKPRRVSK